MNSLNGRWYVYSYDKDDIVNSKLILERIRITVNTKPQLFILKISTALNDLQKSIDIQQQQKRI